MTFILEAGLVVVIKVGPDFVLREVDKRCSKMSNNQKTLCLIFTFIIVVNVRLIKKLRINIKLISRLRVLKTNCSDF